MSEVENFEFYAWIVRAGFLFRENLRKEMERLGFPDEAFAWSYSDAAKQGDLVQLYQDHGRHAPEAWEAFIADCREKYKTAHDQF